MFTEWLVWTLFWFVHEDRAGEAPPTENRAHRVFSDAINGNN